jgi:predicted RNA-binding Zn-ribbon protein involved in translation (DUF1610 family)
MKAHCITCQRVVETGTSHFICPYCGAEFIVLVFGAVSKKATKK